MEALRIGSQKVQKTIQQRPSTAGRLVKMRMKTKSGAATVCSTACKPISFCWYGHPIAHPLGSVPLFRVIETNDWPASAREGFFRQIKHLTKRTCPPQGDPHAPHDDSGWDSDGGRGGGRLVGLQGASLDSPTASAGREWEPGRATPKARRPTHPPPPCLRSRDAQPERAVWRVDSDKLHRAHPSQIRFLRCALSDPADDGRQWWNSLAVTVRYGSVSGCPTGGPGRPQSGLSGACIAAAVSAGAGARVTRMTGRRPDRGPSRSPRALRRRCLRRAQASDRQSASPCASPPPSFPGKRRPVSPPLSLSFGGDSAPLGPPWLANPLTPTICPGRG